MIGIEIKDGYIDFANIAFKCPYCNLDYWDIFDRFLNKCNKNKNYITKIKCECGKRFGMTYNYMGDAVSFKLIKK